MRTLENNPDKNKGIASLVLGILSLVVVWFGYGTLIALVLSIIGIVLGVGARKELAPDQGRGLATAGMICSIIGLVLSTLWLIACVLCVGAFASTIGAAIS